VAAELQEHGRVVAAQAGAEATDSTIELVSCGRPLLDEELQIVDPETGQPRGENAVGEIWIRGQHVAQGYHDRAEETEATFRARLADGGEDSFLRSGDLGFLRDGLLFVTGRQKELLIIRGRNHYPHDIEATVQNSHAKLIPGGGGAFLVDRDGDELLVLVQEVDRSAKKPQRESIINDIRRNVTAEHDVFVHEVILIRMGTLPRTTSGKVRYADVKQQYANGDLGVVAKWSFADNQRQPQRQRGSGNAADAPDLKQLMQLPQIDDRESLAEEIQTRLLTWLSQTTDVQAGDLEANRPFAEYGLDSLAAMELIGHLEDGLDLKLSPTIAWTYPTPAALSRHLAELMIRDDGELPTAHPTKPTDNTLDQLLSQLEQMPEDEVAAMLATEDLPETPQ
jgi:acyl carrier protein